MTEDARFEDGREKPLKLKALDADDLAVVSTLVQDAVLSPGDMRWQKSARRFAMLVNRYRWEDHDRAEKVRDFERVRALLAIEDVVNVRSSGLRRDDADLVLSVLAVTWAPGPDGTGTVTLTLAGDGAIAIEVEALEVLLQDVTRPYRAPSRRAPGHEV